VQTSEVAGAWPVVTEGPDDLEGLTTDDVHVSVPVVPNVNELLLRVRRKAQPTDGHVVVTLEIDEPLGDILTVEREHLDAAMISVSDVNKTVVRHLDRVHAVEVLRPIRIINQSRRQIYRRRPAGGIGITPKVGRRLDPEGSPHPLERQRLGIQHQHPPVRIAVGHKQLVGLREHHRLGREVDTLDIGVATHSQRMPIRSAKLGKELALAGELEDHVVRSLRRACISLFERVETGDPDVVLVINEQAVFRVGPVVAIGGSTPSLDEVALFIEL
jgi:hypothetical protein